MLAVIQESNEDIMVAIRVLATDYLERSRVALMVVVRGQGERIGEVLGAAEVECKYGIGTAEQMKQNANKVENILNDQARLLKNILKRDEEQGGKMKGTVAAKLYERPSDLGSSGLGADMGGGMGAMMGVGLMGGGMMEGMGSIGGAQQQ